jgi:hypothetical protein
MTGKRHRWKRKAMPNRRRTKWEKGGAAVTEHEDLKAFLALRNEVFANPTLEGALEFWNAQGFPPPVGEDVPLATVHRARGQWLDATNEQLAESEAWLKDRGYKTTYSEHEVPMLTPQKRDAQRVMLGKPPLGSAQ